MGAPIYVKAIPRSGGTLLTTMLDAHPEVAMSYEIYSNGLAYETGERLTPTGLAEILQRGMETRSGEVAQIKEIADKNIRTFCFRARRGGIELQEIIDELARLETRTVAGRDSDWRHDLIDALMSRKAVKESKRIWGGKTQTDLYSLHDRFPDATFLIMLRDVRDMYASMINRGSFHYTAREAATRWYEEILGFREFVRTRCPNAMEIDYQELVNTPAAVLDRICQLIGIKYSVEMIDYAAHARTLFRNPHGHLSSEQLQKGLSTASIGRWKTDLSQTDITEIMSIAGDLIDVRW